LLELDFGLVERLVRDGSYIETLIDGELYQKDRATLTAGVQALLLTNGGDLPAVRGSSATSPRDSGAVVEQLARILRDRRAKIERILSDEAGQMEAEHGDKHSALKLNLLEVTTHAPLAEKFHPRTEKFQYLWWKELFYFVPVVLVLCSALLYSMARWGRNYAEILLLVVGTVVIWFGGACFVRHFEWNVNEHFSSLPRALVFFPFYLLPFFNYVPLTQDGQSAVRITALVSFLLFGGFATPLAKKLLQYVWRVLTKWLLRSPRIPRDLKNHIVIVNRSPRTDDVIKKLRASEAGKRRKIVLVARKEEDVLASADPNLFTVVGDPAAVACLKSAQVAQADVVTILPAWPSPNDPKRKWLRGAHADNKTNSAIAAIHKHCEEENLNSTLLVVAEFWEEKNIEQGESAPIAVGSKGGKIQVRRLRRGWFDEEWLP
jgi:hypothetical protein